MTRFPEVQRAISELRSCRHIMFGLHDGPELKVGVPGREVAEIPFDPALHDPLAINHLSIWEDILGTPHVKQVVPARPIKANVIIYRDPLEELVLPWLSQVAETKSRISSELESAILASHLPGDRIRSRMIDEENLFDAERAIDDIAKSGLTFVIGSFNRLRLPRQDASSLGMVAIKVNHPLELALPANAGTISVGGLRSCNTNKPKELAKTNQELAERSYQIPAELIASGAAVAGVVYDPRLEGGLDVVSADNDIANAIRRTTNY